MIGESYEMYDCNSCINACVTSLNIDILPSKCAFK